ncbi:MAG: bacillithiol system redox-active protein YtxJ [Bacteroidia bacterium]
MNWLMLVTEEQLIEINRLSQSADISGVIIFKHSSRCSISSMALNRLERSWNLSDKHIPAYFLDILTHRPLSNAVSGMYGINHESPQLLLIKNGKCIYSASHSNIFIADIQSAMT